MKRKLIGLFVLTYTLVWGVHLYTEYQLLQMLPAGGLQNNLTGFLGFSCFLAAVPLVLFPKFFGFASTQALVAVLLLMCVASIIAIQEHPNVFGYSAMLGLVVWTIVFLELAAVRHRNQEAIAARDVQVE